MKQRSTSPIDRLYRAALEITDKSLLVFGEQGICGSELRIPVLMKGTDLRVTIERGPRIAALNAIEHAQMQASDKPAPENPRLDALRRAMQLIATHAEGIKNGAWNVHSGQWGDPIDERAHALCERTLADLDRMAMEMEAEK